MIKLVLSDIDGTLLPFGQWYIDDETKEAFAALEDVGIRFGPASGRPIDDINKAFIDPVYSSTCIACDGLVVMADGNVALAKNLPNDQLQSIADEMSKMDDIALAVCFNDRNDPQGKIIWGAVNISDAAKEMIKPHIKYGGIIPSLDAVPNNRIYVTGMLGPMDGSSDGKIASVVAEKTVDLVTHRSAPGFHDVCFKSWTKANGANALLEYLGISLDEVVFLGDSTNDLALFELFDNTFCAKSGHPVAMAASRWIMDDPQDGGAIAVMRALANNKGDLEAALEELGL